MKKSKSAIGQPEPLEPHELAGELTHEQRVSLAKGLGDLYRRKVAEDAERQKANDDETPRQ
jgi:hypothetical protein